MSPHLVVPPWNGWSTPVDQHLCQQTDNQPAQAINQQTDEVISGRPSAHSSRRSSHKRYICMVKENSIGRFCILYRLNEIIFFYANSKLLCGKYMDYATRLCLWFSTSNTEPVWACVCQRSQFSVSFKSQDNRMTFINKQLNALQPYCCCFKPVWNML